MKKLIENASVIQTTIPARIRASASPRPADAGVPGTAWLAPGPVPDTVAAVDVIVPLPGFLSTRARSNFRSAVDRGAGPVAGTRHARVALAYDVRRVDGFPLARE